MARKIVVIALLSLAVAAFVGPAFAAEEVNPAPKVSPDSPSAAPLPAEKGDDNTIGAGDDGGAGAPGMAVAAPGGSPSSGGSAATVQVCAAAGVATVVAGFFLF